MENKKQGKRALKHNILLFLKLLNVILVTAPFVCCWYWYYSKQIVDSLYTGVGILTIVLYMIVYFKFTQIYDALLVSLNRISELIYSQILSALFSDGIIYLVIAVFCGRLPNVLPGVGAIIVQAAMIVVWSLLAHRWYYKAFPPLKTVIVYDAREGMEKLISQYELERKFKVKDIIHIKDALTELDDLIGMETVFLSGIHSHDRNIVLKFCVEHGIRVYVIPRVGDVIMSGAVRIHMFHLPVLRVERYNPSIVFLFLKRLMDLVIAGSAAIILSPIMLITAVCIKAYDKGPVFYRQTRLTKDGKEFEVLKFRSMKVDAEKDGVARLSSGESDPRITPIGRFIRKCRIDELPQLFNILSGDMSIVGPRPERPAIAAEYEELMPEFRLRLQAKAGLTGYAQVYGKYNTSPYDKLQMDLMYISHPSILDDLAIMFATVKILFMPESTEGIAEGQTTAMGDAAQHDWGSGSEAGRDAQESRQFTHSGT